MAKDYCNQPHNWPRLCMEYMGQLFICRKMPHILRKIPKMLNKNASSEKIYFNLSFNLDQQTGDGIEQSKHRKLPRWRKVFGKWGCWTSSFRRNQLSGTLSEEERPEVPHVHGESSETLRVIGCESVSSHKEPIRSLWVNSWLSVYKAE